MLSGMALFKDLSAEGLADAANRGRVRNVARGAVIFSQGDDATACHALLEGRVRITQSNEDGAELLVRFIGPGEMFGTVGLFTDGRYPAEAVAVLDSIEIHWPEPVLSDLLARHPPIALNMVRIIGARLRDMQERLREVGLLRVERRIAHVLLRLAAQASHGDAGARTIDFPLTRKDVADMCGTTLHTASRILAAWQEAGLLTTDRQWVTLHDVAAIRRIADEGALA